MFRDFNQSSFKEFGFRLETTHLRDPQRFSRLLLCVCLAHVWLMNAGVWLSKRSLRRTIDRHRARQLSYFQIGWRYLLKLLACGQPLRCELAAYS
jgi:hypothetical protein